MTKYEDMKRNATMYEKEINKYADEMLKRIDEKEGKSLKRLRIFSFVFLFIGLEIINILIQMKIEPLIMILIVDFFALAVGVVQHNLGLKSGMAIGKRFRKLDNQRSKETENQLLKIIFGRNLIPFGYLGSLYFVSKEGEKYTLYDNRKILIPEPEEDVLSVAKMAWENS